MKIYDILMKMNESNSTLHKKEVLRKYKDNKLFQKVCYLTYNKQIQFFIKKIPTYSPRGEFTLEASIDRLYDLSNRVVTGQAGIDLLKGILSELSFEDAQVVERIIKRDLKVKATKTLINECIGPVIPSYPYMGALSYNKKKVLDMFANNSIVYSDLKYDGRYCDSRVEDGKIKYLARGGNETFIYGSTLDDEVRKLSACFDDEVIFNGELMVEGVDRYTSNGIIASLVTIGKKIAEGTLKKEKEKFTKEYNMTYEDALDKLYYVIWDYIPKSYYNENKEYNEIRQDRLLRLMLEIGYIDPKKIKLVEYKIVKTPKEAMEHFLEMLKKGEEGTILKAGSGTWRDGKHNNQIKFKLEMNMDLKIVGFNWGTKGTKNENVISSLKCESSDGRLITNPGGMSEPLMQFVTDNQEQLLGTIVEVKCCGTSVNSNDDLYSLLHPSVVKLRDDKLVANSLEEILEIEEASKELENS